MKIFDCTTFFNENTMLEVRLNILNPYVHKFVIVESKYSHSGNKKKLNFDIKRFDKFKKKIIYLVVDEEPENLHSESNVNLKEKKLNPFRENAIKRIAHQRDYLLKGIQDADANDFIFYSDNDEIPKFENIDLNKNINRIVAFKQKLFYYKFNLFCDRVNWHGTRGCKKKHLKSFSWLRDIKIKRYSKFRFDTIFSNTKYIDLKIINDGGWHFSQLKSPEDLYIKLNNHEEHSEFKESKQTLSDIKDLIERKVINFDHNEKFHKYKYSKEFKLKNLSLNEMPKFLQENVDKYSKWFDLPN